MKKIKNITLKKEINKVNKNLFICIIFFVLGFSCIAYGFYENYINKEKYDYLNNIIENKNNESGVYAYLKVVQAPYSIAKYEDEEDKAFYIIYDGTYFYIAYLNDKLYNKLSVEDIENNPITIYGTTTKTPLEVRQIALEVYNEGLEAEDQITMDNFNNYFGEVYLNNCDLQKLNSTFYLISIIPFVLSIISLIVFVIKKIKTKQSLAKLSDEDIEKLEQEIENEDAKIYSKYHLILTNNFIICFINGLKIFKYEDILWIYEQNFKQYGITTAKNIFIMDKKGKTYHILNTDTFKKSKDLIKEIIEYISAKNTKIIIGYNKKNELEINKILKNS